jgi:hypothetical protein
VHSTFSTSAFDALALLTLMQSPTLELDGAVPQLMIANVATTPTTTTPSTILMILPVFFGFAAGGGGGGVA